MSPIASFGAEIPCVTILAHCLLKAHLPPQSRRCHMSRPGYAIDLSIPGEVSPGMSIPQLPLYPHLDALGSNGWGKKRATQDLEMLWPWGVVV